MSSFAQPLPPYLAGLKARSPQCGTAPCVLAVRDGVARSAPRVRLQSWGGPKIGGGGRSAAGWQVASGKWDSVVFAVFVRGSIDPRSKVRGRREALPKEGYQRRMAIRRNGFHKSVRNLC